MIKLVPSPRIATTSALLGALIAALLWAVAQILFVFWTGQVMRLSIVYGSLAAIPLFLIWLYVGWMIVLCALEVSFVHQYKVHRRRPSPEPLHSGPGVDLLLGLEIYFAIAERFASGSEAPTEEEIARHLKVPARDLIRFIDALKTNGVVVESGRHANRFIPSQSLQKTTVFEVARALYGTQNLGLTGDDVGRTAVRLFLELTGAAESAISDLSVADYIKRVNSASVARHGEE